MAYTKQNLRIDLQNLARYVESVELDEFTLQEWAAQEIERIAKEARRLAETHTGV